MSDAICRCCLTQGCYKDIATEYYFNGKTEVYADMLKDTFDLTLSNSNKDTLNRKRFICNSCITRLRDATDFKRQVQECDIIFNEQFKDNGTSSDQIIMEIKPLVKQEKIDHEEYPDMTDHCGDDADHDIGYDDDDDDDLDDDVPLSKRAKKNVKKELEIEKTITVEYNPSILETILTTDDTPKPTSEVKEKTKKKPSTSKAAKGESSKAKRVIKVVRKQEVKKKGDALAVESNAEVILKYSTVYPFMVLRGQYACCFCSQFFEDPSVFRSHVDTDHKTVNKLDCFENKKYKSRVDITNNRCKICNEEIDNFDALLNHLKLFHNMNVDLSKEHGLVPMKIQKDRFECILCGKRFSGITELNRHTAKYTLVNNICEQCGKNFQTINALKLHVDTSHTDKFVCRTCKKAFDTFNDKKEHMIQNYKCLPNSCPKCKQRFLTWEFKQKHLEEVHGQEKIVNKCKECGQDFRTRTILYLHFRNAHTDALKCTQCDKKFLVRRDFDAHMFLHTGEAPFQCSICAKKFRSKNNLRKHVKTHNK